MKISYTQLRMWKRCKRKWWYRYVNGLIPKQRRTPITLGIYGHMLLENHYMGNDVKLSSNHYYQQLIRDQPEDMAASFAEIREQAENLYKRYVRHYKTHDQNWEVVVAEREYEVPIPGTADAHLRFTVDLIVQTLEGEVWLVDHKFTRQDLESWGDWLVLDEQANLYLWGLKELGHNVNGVIFNLIRTKEPTIPKLLKSGQLSKAKSIDTDPDTYLQAILDNRLNVRDYIDVLEHLETTSKPFFKRYKAYRTADQLEMVGKEISSMVTDFQANRDSYPVRHATHDCRWDCPYLGLCIMDSKQIDPEYYISVEFERNGKNLDCKRGRT